MLGRNHVRTSTSGVAAAISGCWFIGQASREEGWASDSMLARAIGGLDEGLSGGSALLASRLGWSGSVQPDLIRSVVSSATGWLFPHGLASIGGLLQLATIAALTVPMARWPDRLEVGVHRGITHSNFIPITMVVLAVGLWLALPSIPVEGLLEWAAVMVPGVIFFGALSWWTHLRMDSLDVAGRCPWYPLGPVKIIVKPQGDNADFRMAVPGKGKTGAGWYRTGESSEDVVAAMVMCVHGATAIGCAALVVFPVG